MATTNLFGTQMSPQEFIQKARAVPNPTGGKIGPQTKPANYQAPAVAGASSNTLGGSNGFNALQEDARKQGILQEQSNKPSDKDFDAIIAPALKALSGYQKSLEGSLPGIYSTLEGQADVSRNNLNSSAADISNRYGTQKTQAQQSADNAVAEARRQFSELQRGLQAQYGGTTGTGAFSAELAGRQTFQNIGNVRTGLQDTMMQIADAEESLKRDVQNKMFELDKNLTAAKESARRDLMEKIQQINLKKGELESNKASQKMDAMREYRLTQAQIEASNKQFLQGLYADYQSKFGMLSKAKDEAVNGFDLSTLGLGDAGGFTPTEAKPTTAPQGDIWRVDSQTDDPLGLGIK